MRALLLVVALLAPLPALAHPGDAAHLHGFADGLLHPIGGLDHLAAMLAVGAWGALTGGAARWLLPAGFLAGMAAGGALGLAGVDVPMVEAGILASVIVLGVLVGAAARLPVAAGLALLAAFGLLHGHAHGTEGAGAAAYAAGFLMATAGLHGAGLLLAARAGGARGRLALRAAGAAASVAALVVLVV